MQRNNPADIANPGVLARAMAAVVGRGDEIETVLAAVAAGRHMVLEGPPGTGKSTLVRCLAQATDRPFLLVEGHSELTPARLIGHHDPSRVLAEGYGPGTFVEGPLVEAATDGAILYVEELNRVPEDTLNVLVTIMSEGEIHVPRAGVFRAAPGFAIVAAMNPFDAVGTARISAAISDRTCRVAMGYQSAADEVEITRRHDDGGGHPAAWLERVVELVRRTRNHPDIRVGSSVRGAIDLVLVAASLARLRGTEPWRPEVTRQAALTALSGRIRLNETSGRSAENIILTLFAEVFGHESETGGATVSGLVEDTRGKVSPTPA